MSLGIPTNRWSFRAAHNFFAKSRSPSFDHRNPLSSPPDSVYLHFSIRACA